MISWNGQLMIHWQAHTALVCYQGHIYTFQMYVEVFPWQRYAAHASFAMTNKTYSLIDAHHLISQAPAFQIFCQISSRLQEILLFLRIQYLVLPNYFAPNSRRAEPLRIMTSSRGNVSGITSPLWGESTADRCIPPTKVSNAELRCFFILCLNKLLNKQSSCR